MECEPFIEWFFIEYWMIIDFVSFACPFDWFYLWLRVCLIDFIWIKLFDWFVDLFSHTCLIALRTLTMHSLHAVCTVSVYFVCDRVCNTSVCIFSCVCVRVCTFSVSVSVHFVYACVCDCCCCCDRLCLCLCLCILSVSAPVLYLSMHWQKLQKKGTEVHVMYDRKRVRLISAAFERGKAKL